MNLLLLFFPVVILMLACIGLGLVLYRLFRGNLPPMKIWVNFVVTYFLGQGVLASILLLLAVWDCFYSSIIWGISLSLAVLAASWIIAHRLEWEEVVRSSIKSWRLAPFSWKLISFSLLLLLISGIATLGSWFVIDGSAFYMVIAKLMAGNGRLVPLPGIYESFSSVGLLAETLTAALMSMGMPNNSAKILSWANYLPTTVILYAIARQCEVSRRGALLSVIMATTSSAVLLLWGSGKTDLFALGPALVAVFLALHSWQREYRKGVLCLSGLLAGFSFVLKLSYIAVLLPVLVLIIFWPTLFEIFASLKRRDWAKFKDIILTALGDSIIYGIAILGAMLPHLIKNHILLNTFIGLQASNYSKWYSPGTIKRLLLSYPLALTYGNYWAQFGTMSPLILAFIPLIIYLRKTVNYIHNKLLSLSVGTIAGILAWIIFFPSIFMPRYILVVLVLCAIAPAAAAVEVSTSHKMLSKLIVLSTMATMIYIPTFTDRIFKSFDYRLALNYPMGKEREYLTARPNEDNYWALEAVNRVAPQNSKILLLTYLRFWLRSDLLLNDACSKDFLMSTINGCSLEDFWDYIFKNNISYVVLDTTVVSQISVKEIKDAVNKYNLKTKTLFEKNSLFCFEILKGY
jgi:hypothetical protein